MSAPVRLTFPSLDGCTTREEIRSIVLNTWLLEVPATKYEYLAEKLSDERWVILKRPAQLNKGCDFRIVLENEFLHNKLKSPKHVDIYNAISDYKAKLTKVEYNNFTSLLTRIYNLGTTVEVMANLTPISFSGLVSMEAILVLSKWLFIEQDISYWGYSGRDKLFKYFSELF